ncbi:MAG TPA: c-type cytochrome [Xanthobacteraceae bacterium]|jgi:cytochrome c-L
MSVRLFRRAAFAAAIVVPMTTGVRAGNLSDFKDPFDGSPLKISPVAGETETPVVKKFTTTGDNDYRGNAEAIAAGKSLYTANCAACHGDDGKGRIGPTLVGDGLKYPQAKSDPGMFSIIYAGAGGAMQSFAKRGMPADDMLKIIAYVRTLDK